MSERVRENGGMGGRPTVAWVAQGREEEKGRGEEGERERERKN